MKLLVVVDMQKDFITGSLAVDKECRLPSKVAQKVCDFEGIVIFTQDTHDQNYMNSQEGKNLPILHCQKGTEGWEICDELKPYAQIVITKATFGSTQLIDYVHDLSTQEAIDSIELVGVCTDICVITNALLLKAALPEVPMSVSAELCLGSSPARHEAALEVMKSCQVSVI